MSEPNYVVDVPRIYAASLSDYNAGILHGVWIELDGDVESAQEQIDAMLASSPVTERYGEPAEEWAIHDFDGFQAMPLGEYDSLQTVCDLASTLIELGDDAEAYTLYAANVGLEYATVEGFREAYNGQWSSEKDFAYDLLDDLGEVKGDSLAERYFDYDAFTLDLFMGDYFSIGVPSGGVYVFRNM